MQIDFEEKIQRYLFRKRHGREDKMSMSFCMHWALKVTTTIVIWKREKETLPKWKGTSFLPCISKHVSSKDSMLRAHSNALFSWRWNFVPLLWCPPVNCWWIFRYRSNLSVFQNVNHLQGSRLITPPSIIASPQSLLFLLLPEFRGLISTIIINEISAIPNFPFT